MKENILDAAAAVFSEKGYHSAGMDEIALRAGAAKGTLYYHYKSKAALFSAVLEAGVNMVLGRVDAVMALDLPLRETVARIIRVHVDTYMDYPQLASIYFNETSRGLDEEILRTVEALRDRWMAQQTALWEQARRWGLAAPCPPRLMAETVLGMIDGFCGGALRLAQLPPRETLVSTLTALVFDGFFREGGVP